MCRVTVQYNQENSEKSFIWRWPIWSCQVGACYLALLPALVEISSQTLGVIIHDWVGAGREVVCYKGIKMWVKTGGMWTNTLGCVRNQHCGGSGIRETHLMWTETYLKTKVTLKFNRREFWQNRYLWLSNNIKIYTNILRRVGDNWFKFAPKWGLKERWIVKVFQVFTKDGSVIAKICDGKMRNNVVYFSEKISLNWSVVAFFVQNGDWSW